MKNLTLHIVSTVPWSNLNRDDTGTPKRAIIGGVLRTIQSSQSLKRAARTDYELRSLDTSVRSTNLAGIIAKRAAEINSEIDPKKALAASKKMVSALVKKDDPKAQTPEKASSNGAEAASIAPAKESGTTSWLSTEEIETAAAAIATGKTTELNAGNEIPIRFVQPGVTGSLSIAMFGRMFALEPEANTEAAVAVGPAIAVHKTIIETDYFTTVDDDPDTTHSGASFLGVASYTSGVFYRSLTIDREQLRRSWSGMTAEIAREQLTTMMRSLIYKLPSGKKNTTSPYVAPLAVLAEEQSYRLAYDFESPVQAGPNGGFGDTAITSLGAKYTAAREFDAENFGFSLIAGTSPVLDAIPADKTDIEDLVSRTVDWILA